MRNMEDMTKELTMAERVRQGITMWFVENYGSKVTWKVATHEDMIQGEKGTHFAIRCEEDIYDVTVEL